MMRNIIRYSGGAPPPKAHGGGCLASGYRHLTTKLDEISSLIMEMEML